MATPRGPRGYPVRFVVLVPLLTLILVVGGSISFISHQTAIASISAVADDLRSSIVERIGTHVSSFLDIPETINAANAVLLASGALDPSDQMSLESYFQSQVPRYPTVSSIYFGNPSGGSSAAAEKGPKGSTT